MTWAMSRKLARSMRKLRGAIVGYGFIMEKGHVAAYRQRAQVGSGANDVEIVAVADPSPARLELARQQLPGVRVYADHESLLEAEAGKLDFIDIATPPSEHAAVAHAGLDRGLHVLCEKPLATT